MKRGETPCFRIVPLSHCALLRGNSAVEKTPLCIFSASLAKIPAAECGYTHCFTGRLAGTLTCIRLFFNMSVYVFVCVHPPPRHVGACRNRRSLAQVHVCGCVPRAALQEHPTEESRERRSETEREDVCRRSNCWQSRWRNSPGAASFVARTASVVTSQMT